MDDVKDEVISGAQEMLWVSEWASAAERAVEDGYLDELPWGPGAELMDEAPPMTDAAEEAAERTAEFIVNGLESTTGLSIGRLYQMAQASRYDPPESPEGFGHQIALVWLGHAPGFPEVELPNGKELHDVIGWGEFIVDYEPSTGDFEVYHTTADEVRRQRG